MIQILQGPRIGGGGAQPNEHPAGSLYFMLTPKGVCAAQALRRNKVSHHGRGAKGHKPGSSGQMMFHVTLFGHPNSSLSGEKASH